MRKVLLISAIAILAAVSCSKDDYGYASQLEQIDSFVASLIQGDPELKVTNSGDITRVTLAPGEGPEVNAGGYVKFLYAGYVFTGGISRGNIFATNDENLAASIGWNLTDKHSFDPAVVCLDDKRLMEGLKKGLVGVQPGEHCYILFPYRYGMGDGTYGTIPAASALVFDISVIDIENE